MQKYAVIKLNNKQYKVSEGEEVLVDKLNDEKLVAQVLLFVDEKGPKIGTPEVKGAKVAFKVIENEVKGAKVTTSKFRSKSRYRKTVGFRPVNTKIKITKIS